MTFWKHENVDFVLYLPAKINKHRMQKVIKTMTNQTCDKKTENVWKLEVEDDRTGWVCGRREGCGKRRILQKLKENLEHALPPFGGGGFKGLRLCRRPLGSFVCSGLRMLPRLVRLLRLLRWLRFLYFKFGFLIILIIVPHKLFGDLCLELLICSYFLWFVVNLCFSEVKSMKKH